MFFLFSHFREYHYDFMDKMLWEGDEMTYSTIQVMFAFIWEHESNVPHTHPNPQIRINFLTALFSLPHDAQEQNSSINFRKPNNCLETMCKYRFRANTQGERERSRIKMEGKRVRVKSLINLHLLRWRAKHDFHTASNKREKRQCSNICQ